MMVNGGGSVMLEFSRNRLKTRVVSINAGWNQFVIIDPVVLHLSDEPEPISHIEPCTKQMHNTSVVYPVVKSSWKEIRTYYSTSALLIPDSGVIRSEQALGDTGLKLIYSSSLAPGFSSSIFVLLTQSSIPETLQQVHLQIVVEGVIQQLIFDAYPNLHYEFSWDKRNAYEQRVYGFAYAKGKRFVNLKKLTPKILVPKFLTFSSGNRLSIRRVLVYLLGVFSPEACGLRSWILRNRQLEY